MSQNAKIAVFSGKQVRRILLEGQWWFSVADVIGILTESSDPKQYIKKMRQRDPQLNLNWGTICTPLVMVAQDGKKRGVNCANTEGIFRIIQSVSSPKAEPFKRWLARVGKERLDEIENPELAMQRTKAIYEKKGYPKAWIEKRLRGIAVREKLTDEWNTRGAKTELEYAILTNEIMQGAFDLNVEDYKQHKGLKRQNLRDHMTDLELILTMLGEATTTQITQDRDSKEFEKLQRDAKDGGAVAGRTRKDIEHQTGKNVVSNKNFLLPFSKKRNN